MSCNDCAKGSAKRSLSMSDGLATIRDAILLLLSTGLSYLGDNYLGGLDPELHAALVVVIFAGVKLVWKWLTDTKRISTI